MKFPALISFGSFFATIASHAAVTVTTATGNGADTFIAGSTNANNNYGSNSTLLLKNVSPVNDYTRKNYLRFDLAGIEEITAASLDLVVNANNNGTYGFTTSFNVAVYGLNDSTAGQNWDESTITWNNAPGNINSGSSFDGSTSTFLGTLAITSSDDVGDTVSFSSSTLLDFLTADTDGLVTIMLARTDTRVGENLAFNAKETSVATAPTLTLTASEVSAVPEPTSAGLLGLLLGSGTLFIRRRMGR